MWNGAQDVTSASVNNEKIKLACATPSSNMWVKGASVGKLCGFSFWCFYFLFGVLGIFLRRGGLVWIGGLDLLRVAFGVYPDTRQDPNIREMLKIIRQTVLPHKFYRKCLYFKIGEACAPIQQQNNIIWFLVFNSECSSSFKQLTTVEIDKILFSQVF